MKCNGIEYRILKNGTGQLFKVEIKADYFMGFERWMPLYKNCLDMYGNYYYATEKHEYEPFSKVVQYEPTFNSCQDAKKAAIEFCKMPLAKEWKECKC